ncbi:ATP-dependent RNA helicase ddx1 [Saguinus oedipus]|uniref:ATP-dependent RNA helicase n=1 Tax=Saguinus oedipus TaxID=9490 RepID=A0ABQ9U4P0_SAGOE|nr:ATP-dependent RNA helicase ddx1 [Saguinus oedipus]
MHDTIGCYLDIDKGHVKFSKNGKDLGLAFEIPPHMKNQALFPACVLKNAELKFNFGEEEFKFPPKDGFVALSKAPDGYIVKSQHTGNAQVTQTKFLPNAPKALIVEPSRELAEQTLNNVKQFKKYIDNPKLSNGYNYGDLTALELLIIGGVAARDQLSVLENGVDIVVGTPGRLDDLVSTGKLNLSQVRFLVLDEADGLLSQGYSDFINRMHNQIPQVTSDGKRLQVIVCSATLHSFDVKKLSEKIMHFPTWVDLKGEDSVPDTVHHVVVPVNPKTDRLWERLGKNHIRTDDVHAKDNTRPGANSPEMWSEAVKILKGEYAVRAIKEHKMDQAIIFCRTKIDCDNLEQYFMQQGGGPDKKGHQFSCVCLHGDRKPHERKQNLERFKKGDVRFLICTDVAARGIDIHGVPYVINVTLPDEKQNYVHRIGRVGRAERMGLAISLVATEKEKVWYHVCSSRGKGCYNTRLKEDGGCTIWYNEMQLLSEIEEHLNCTISQVEPDIKVPLDEFDGKVTYGQKRAAGVDFQMVKVVYVYFEARGELECEGKLDDPSVEELLELETELGFLQFQLLLLGWLLFEDDPQVQIVRPERNARELSNGGDCAFMTSLHMVCELVLVARGSLTSYTQLLASHRLPLRGRYSEIENPTQNRGFESRERPVGMGAVECWRDDPRFERDQVEYHVNKSLLPASLSATCTVDPREYGIALREHVGDLWNGLQVT